MSSNDRTPRLAPGILGDGWLARLAGAVEPWILGRLGLGTSAAVEQLHLAWGEDAAREVVVSWRTPHEVTEPFVAVEGVRVAARSQVAPGGGWLHHASIAPLDPGTTVAYAVGHGGKLRSRVERVRTAPVGPAPFVFTAFGDHGTDRPAPDVPPTHAARRTVELVEALDPAFHLVAGDLSYANGDARVWDRWLRMIEPSARVRPWMACVGNHEMERSAADGGFARRGHATGGLGYAAYTSRFPLPSHAIAGVAPTFGTFRYAGVRFVLLDNNDVCAEFPANRGHTQGAQRDWLEGVLAQAADDPSIDAVVAVMHQPAFSSAIGHGSDTGVRTSWHPLFVEYGVSLVLQGHDHLYERTHPLAGPSHAPVVSDDGVTYVTCGNGGFAQPGAAGGPMTAWSAARDDRHAGVVHVAVTPSQGERRARLTVSHRAVGAAGVPTDVVTIDARTSHRPRRRTRATHLPT